MISTAPAIIWIVGLLVVVAAVGIARRLARGLGRRAWPGRSFGDRNDVDVSATAFPVGDAGHHDHHHRSHGSSWHTGHHGGFGHGGGHHGGFDGGGHHG
ncbi:hypothetical protein [Actinacidiphila rubida]|uniref:hypothetical protein n=1 Tax=Actinacidiphila rubida TaxID=310780 RepID=UPI0009A064D7|nr:hypothetical protein [Actinacidiphila rubida]